MKSTLQRRRSPRISEQRPIEMTGTNVEGIDFLTSSHTILLSRFGAKIQCEQSMGLGQEITIFHPETGEYCLAKVVGLYGQSLPQGYFYGIEFLEQNCNFWNVQFAAPEGTKVRASEKTQQKEARRRKVVEVIVCGTDRHGHPFTQTAFSLNVSESGACLDGVGFLTTPGATIEVKRGWRKSCFRVVWVGQRGTKSAGRVGIFCLQQRKNIWQNYYRKLW